MIKYSSLTNSFYDANLSADIPSGAIDVAPARHAEIMRELNERGKTLAFDASTGDPVVVDSAPPPVNVVAASVRQQRNRLLAESDWVVVRACETSLPVPQLWKAYRKALRDLPSQSGFPTEVVWPTLQG